MEMGLFKSKEEKARLSNMKNIISVSMADGDLGEDELTLIALAAARDNISEKDVEKMLKGSDRIKFTVPETDELKMQFLTDMVILMSIDGKIGDGELAMCKNAAVHFGYSPEVIDQLLPSILEDMEEAEEK